MFGFIKALFEEALTYKTSARAPVYFKSTGELLNKILTAIDKIATNFSNTNIAQIKTSVCNAIKLIDKNELLNALRETEVGLGRATKLKDSSEKTEITFILLWIGGVIRSKQGFPEDLLSVVLEIDKYICDHKITDSWWVDEAYMSGAIAAITIGESKGNPILYDVALNFLYRYEKKRERRGEDFSDSGIFKAYITHLKGQTAEAKKMLYEIHRKGLRHGEWALRIAEEL